MLATCWRITRSDGVVFGFTDHDRDLVVDGEVYGASAGYSRTAIANDAGMGVDNLDVEGVFDSAAVTDEELRAGLFDRAEVHIFLINWADAAMGVLRLRRGWFGEVVLTEQGVLRTELRGLTQALSKRIGELYSPECRADLGDHRCRVPIQPPVVAREPRPIMCGWRLVRAWARLPSRTGSTAASRPAPRRRSSPPTR